MEPCVNLTIYYISREFNVKLKRLNVHIFSQHEFIHSWSV